MSTSTASLPVRRLDTVGVRVALALGTIYIVWSTTFMAIRVALNGLPPFTLGAVRYCAAALVMLAVALATRTRRPQAREVAGAALMGLAIVLVPNAAVVWAEQSIPTGVTSLLGACTPLFVLGFESLMPGGERPSTRGVAGMLLGLVGVAGLVAPQLAGGLGAGAVAQIGCLAGSLVCAFAMVWGRRVPVPGGAAYNSALTMLFGGLAFGVCAWLHGETAGLHFGEVLATSWLALAYLVVFGSCLGFTAFNWLLRNARPTLVSTTSYVNPVLAMGVGMVVLGEPLSAGVFVAAATIVASVVLVAGARR